MSALLKTLSRLERWAAIAAFAVMTLALMADVVSRRLFQSGLTGAIEIAIFGMIALAMFGIGIATDHAAHLRPTVFDGLVPQRLRPGVARLADLLTGLFFVVLAGFAAWMVAESMMLGDRTAILRVPVWALQSMLLLAFLGNALRFLAYCADPSLRPPERTDGAPR